MASLDRSVSMLGREGRIREGRRLIKVGMAGVRLMAAAAQVPIPMRCRQCGVPVIRPTATSICLPCVEKAADRLGIRADPIERPVMDPPEQDGDWG